MSYQYLIGRELCNGKYKVVSFIGAGGMSEVYEGFDNDLNRKVAIKILKRQFLNDPYYNRRFREEARIAADCDHPHIVKIYDKREEDGIHYIAMQYLPKNLSSILKTQKVMSPLEAVKILRDIAEALVYVHKRGVVHRDIKIGNIMFDEHNNPILTDFGIATREDSTRIAQGMPTTGTPEYMSPEQIKGQNVDFRSDIYSLGIVLYELVTGNTPFSGEDPNAVFYQHIYEPVPEKPLRDNNVPKRIREIIFKCLAKSPKERFQSTQELVTAFDDFIRNPLTPKEIRYKHGEKSDIVQESVGDIEPVHQKQLILKRIMIITVPVLMVGVSIFYFVIRNRGVNNIKLPKEPVSRLYIILTDSATKRRLPYAGEINITIDNPAGPRLSINGIASQLDFYKDSVLIFSKDFLSDNKYKIIDKISYSLNESTVNLGIQAKFPFYEPISVKTNLFKGDTEEIVLKLQPIDMFCGKCGYLFYPEDTVCPLCKWRRRKI